MSTSYRSVTSDLEQWVLSRACVPEHIVSMMAALSGGSPLIAGDYLMFHARDWLIFVGYPLGGQCQTTDYSDTLTNAARDLKVSTVWFVGPSIPAGLADRCDNAESDAYYRLDCAGFEVPGPLRRGITKASQHLSVECSREFTAKHEALSAQYALKLTVRPRVKALYTGIRRYVDTCGDARVLSAWDHSGNLAAFFIVDLSAAHFTCYLIGGYSTSHYVPHASDVLFQRMVTLSQECNKDYIHLGLGVNRGIQRFKMKWGGTPFLQYMYAEYRPHGYGIKNMLKSLIAQQ